MRLLILNYDMFSEYHQSFLFVPEIVDCTGVKDIVFVCKEQEINTMEQLILKEDGLYCSGRDHPEWIATHEQLWACLQAGSPVRIHWRPTGGIHTTDIFPMELVPSSVVTNG